MIDFPSCVKPSPSKQDMEALTVSIPKYLCLKDAQKQWWRSFFDKLKEEFEKECSNVEERWELTQIGDIAEDNHTEILPDPLIPSELIERHANCTDDIPEVSS